MCFPTISTLTVGYEVEDDIYLRATSTTQQASKVMTPKISSASGKRELLFEITNYMIQFGRARCVDKAQITLEHSITHALPPSQYPALLEVGPPGWVWLCACVGLCDYRASNLLSRAICWGNGSNRSRSCCGRKRVDMDNVLA